MYASRGTGRQLCYRIAFLEELFHPVTPGEGFSVGGIDVESFPTSHDAAESTGYALSAGGRKAAVVTDLGYVTPEVERGIRGADLLVCEANHDVEWLQAPVQRGGGRAGLDGGGGGRPHGGAGPPVPREQHPRPGP